LIAQAIALQKTERKRQMKYVKMLGLTAVAAMALAAFAGAGTASATTVCTSGTTTSPCLTGQTPYSGKIVAKLKPGTKAVLKGSLNVECTESVVSGTTNSKGEGKIESATFAGTCTTCPKVTSLTPWNAHAVTGTAPNGQLIVEKPVVHLEQCFGFAKCTATASAVELEVIGGSPARVIAKEEPLTISGFGCGTSGTWTAEYEVTTPSSLFLEP
jgi:hypothetical protein